MVYMKLTEQEIQAIQEALKNPSHSKHHKRLQMVLFHAKGKSHKEIMALLDCHRTTIWRTLQKYTKEGLEGLLREGRGGRHREYMTYEEEVTFLNKHLSQSLTGEFVTIDLLFEAYQKQVGHSITREGFYALLKRHGWTKTTPRPEHPKKADASTIQVSKNKIFILEDKKAL